VKKHQASDSLNVVTVFPAREIIIAHAWYSVKKTQLMAMPLLRRLVTSFALRQPGFNPRSGHVGFVVDIVALGQVFFEYFSSPCQFLFH
jgi:hypothetical protein